MISATRGGWFTPFDYPWLPHGASENGDGRILKTQVTESRALEGRRIAKSVAVYEADRE